MGRFLLEVLMKQRNMVVRNMIARSQKAGHHGDKKKKQSKTLCRKKVKYDWRELFPHLYR